MMYYGHIRANGGSIRGHKGAAGGVIPWIKLANDTAVAVDQLGVRQGAVSVTLDAWHKDLPEFLQLRTNNGDDRMKAHDVFPAVAYPDLFWEMAENDRRGTWYLFDPHEVEAVMGFKLEDYYGKEWEEKYKLCIDEPALSKRKILVIDLIRLIITSLVETGTPFTIHRDAANRMNPNKHEGMIYSSNLCVTGDTELLTEDGYKNMKELYDSQEDFSVVVDERARTMNAKAEGVSIQSSTKVYKTMENAEVWKITTEDGQELKATPYHKMYVKRDGEIIKIPLHECKIGDDLLIPHVEGSYGKVEDESLAFILGIIASDGSTYRTVSEDGAIIYLYGDKQSLKEEVDMHLEAITKKYPEYFEPNKYYQNTRMNFKWISDKSDSRISLSSVPLGKLLVDKGVHDKMVVPKFIKEGTRETQEAYLRGRWITDGTFIIGEQTSFELGSVDGDNLRDIQKIMSGMGIRTQLYYSDKRGDSFEYTTVGGEHRVYSSKPIYSLRATSLLNTNKMYERNIIRDSAKKAFRDRIASTRTSFYKTKKDRYSKIASITENYSVEDVYDVRVDNGHSLIFNGIATGNCTEIFMNQSPSTRVKRLEENGEVVEVTKPGDFPVCNLASLVLGNIDLNDPKELEHVVTVAIRALDNVITHNYYPTPYAEVSNNKYRAVGLGASGYHHALVKNGIFYSSDKHLEYMDRVFEDIAFYAVSASNKLALEKGSYPAFEGSDWHNGDYFKLREYNSERWQELQKSVKTNGMRNGWLMAVAPTGLIIIGSV